MHGIVKRIVEENDKPDPAGYTVFFRIYARDKGALIDWLNENKATLVLRNIISNGEYATGYVWMPNDETMMRFKLTWSA